MNQEHFNQMDLLQLEQQYQFHNFGAPAWDVLKDHHKWRGAKVVVPGRRIRTDDDIEESNELFQNDTIPRPPGKLSPSKSQRSDSTKSAGSLSSRETSLK
ncbi:hypothetical protein Tco_1376257 [Tanacetum coccineum]|uniref:Uncharacterized protein n=1 Tax=Tanacetum coccineum TaxID=301880 RepID=A0ABQ5GVX3_9ASTR